MDDRVREARGAPAADREHEPGDDADTTAYPGWSALGRLPRFGPGATAREHRLDRWQRAVLRRDGVTPRRRLRRLTSDGIDDNGMQGDTTQWLAAAAAT